MSTFPCSPKAMKGAIIGLDPFDPLASVIIFQYSSESLTGTLHVRVAESETT
ncbi:MAG TPA: hypothetical protein VNN22_06555 [Verrucomicrobiae bacterium]|nr:hypothetical protein [Verrucomicrobiae bacterium]